MFFFSFIHSAFTRTPYYLKKRVIILNLGENLMTQSLIQAPYRRIRHPELVPVILNNKEERNHGKYCV